jgi:hypothetical protein
MTEKDFRNLEANRVDLAQMLLNPVLQNALGILTDAMAPKIAGDAELNPNIAAARHHRATGANYVIEGLTRLTRPPVESKAPRGKALFNSPDEIPEGLLPD